MLFPFSSQITNNTATRTSSSAQDHSNSLALLGGGTDDLLSKANDNAMCNVTKSLTSSSNGSGGSMQHQQNPFAFSSFPSPASNGLDANATGGRTRWQTSSDIPDRLRLLTNIRNVVVQKMLRSPGAGNMIHKLPTMTRKMEEILYRAAHSRQEYLDLSTLEDRLAMIAHALETTPPLYRAPVAAAPGAATMGAAAHLNHHRQLHGGARGLDIGRNPTATTSSDSWQHHGNHQEDRLKMLVHVRQAMKKQISENQQQFPRRMLEKLPQVAKMMEAALFKSAPTKKDYMDMSTLRDRLQCITDDLMDIRQQRRGGNIL